MGMGASKMAMPNEISGALLLFTTILLIIGMAIYAGLAVSAFFALALILSLAYWLVYEQIVRRRVSNAVRRPTWAFWAQIGLILAAVIVVLYIQPALGLLLMFCSLIGYGLGLYCARSFKNGD